MKDLTNQIVNDLVDPNVQLSDTMRKAAVLAAKLRHESFREWVRLEQAGYSPNDQIPDYRSNISHIIKGHFIGAFGRQLNNADIPMSSLPKPLLEYARRLDFRQGIRALENLMQADNPGGVLRVLWAAELAASIPEVYEGMFCLSAWKAVSVSQFHQLLDTVRNRLLSFVLQLQEQVPELVGDKIEFKESAQMRLQQIFNTEISGGVTRIGDTYATTQGGIHMGDNYTQGQGFQGPNMEVHDNTITYQQIWKQVSDGVDFDAITADIEKARQHIKQLPESDDNDLAAAAFVQARKASEEKDGSKLIERLKALPEAALSAVKEVAAMTLAELIKRTGIA